ncbi:MAG: ParB/RepB/Spo0J family partition protein, partial [Ruminococcus sp.]|nr:ParB/RepB/Spo0J family partition protein [Ruminococcus sp.]
MNTQFNLGAMLSTPTALQNAVKQIPCDMLKSYHNHRFELYTGERLEDMVESIKENGVLSPIIVQPCNSGYEILIGHNRWNASKIAGLPTVPAIVKEELSEDEAEMYVIESNLMQRGFDNLKISEQAAVIAQRHSEMFSQGKRNDIIRELQMLDGTVNLTSRPMGEKLDTDDVLSEQYGLSSRNVSRLLRINKLIDELKNLIDNGTLAVRSGVELSFLSEETQLEISELAEDYKIDMKKAKQLRDSADNDGNVSNADIIRILDGKKTIADKGKSVKISNDIY